MIDTTGYNLRCRFRLAQRHLLIGRVSLSHTATHSNIQYQNTQKRHYNHKRGSGRQLQLYDFALLEMGVVYNISLPHVTRALLNDVMRGRSVHVDVYIHHVEPKVTAEVAAF